MAKHDDDGEPLVDIVGRAQGGDPLAFEALVHRFRDSVVAFTCALLRDRWLADDVTQETFLQVYRRLGDLRDPAAFRPWLFRIAEHTALSGWRRRKRVREMSLRDDDGAGQPMRVAETLDGLACESGVEIRDDLCAVRDAMECLPENYGTVLSLHYVQNLSCKEIGERLGLRANNVKVRLHRARKALRRDLEARGLGPEVAETAAGDDEEDLPVAAPVA
ncbi:MAG: RNA polymerase sigma factor [Planctomycetota bacterium]|jgi:RNA polymerase sigma-70 factor (ECF subfamily)